MSCTKETIQNCRITRSRSKLEQNTYEKENAASKPINTQNVKEKNSKKKDKKQKSTPEKKEKCVCFKDTSELVKKFETNEPHKPHVSNVAPEGKAGEEPSTSRKQNDGHSDDNEKLKTKQSNLKIKKINKEATEKTNTAVMTISSLSLKTKANKNVVEIDTNPNDNGNVSHPLQTVISNLYLDVGKRLRLDFPPRCLYDLAHCHRHHYSAELPEAPIPTLAHSLRCALQQYRYMCFINVTTDMCIRGVFPGKCIFTNIIELVLSINYNTKQNILTFYYNSYFKVIELFSIVVRTFPPCWRKIRTYYIGLLEDGIDQAKLGDIKNEPLTNSSKIFDIILDLLEDFLQNATSEELATSVSDMLQVPGAVNMSQQNSMELSGYSDYWNQNEYEERERQNQTYTALPQTQKIERIFMCLRLLLEILENDLPTWMLNHFSKTKEWIFYSDNSPLIVVLCELTQHTRMTRVVRRIFSIYSISVAKGLSKDRLQILERYISLLMVASNTADMEITAIGVKYPALGDQTKTLIKEFFKIFKVHNREEISKYMETIDLLRIPFVRFEFIDNVLFTNTEQLSPQKIAMDMAKRRWLIYKPCSELAEVNDEISREQYLHLLLDALRQYCDWHGSKTFLHAISDSKQISLLSTTNDSVHRWPTNGTGVLVLKKMEADIKQLENQLKMTVRMSKAKVNIALADICIDEATILKYRTDLKFLLNLQNVVLRQKESYPEVDFSKWLEYLSGYPSQKVEKLSEQEQQSTLP